MNIVKLKTSKYFNLFTILLSIAIIVSSKAFNSPSLATFFFVSILFSLYSVLLGLKAVYNSKVISLNIEQYIILALIFVTILNGLIFNSFTFYHLYYLSFFLILFLGIYSSSEKECDTKFLKFCVLSIVLTECLVVYLQYFKFITPNNSYFNTTGTSSNPNITASLIAFSFFALPEIKFFSKPNFLLKFLYLGAVSVALLMLSSRTALIVFCLFLVSEFFASNKLKMNNKWKIVILLILLSALILLISFCFKVNSTIGRIVIWENIINIFKTNAVLLFTGNGIGTFEDNYNKTIISKNMPFNGHVNMAYNDYFQMVFESGFVFAFLWILLIVIDIHNKRKDTRYVFLLVGVVFTQMVNFLFVAIPVVVMILFCQSSLRDKHEQSDNERKKYLGKLIYWFMFILSCINSYLLLDRAYIFSDFVKTTKTPDSEIVLNKYFLYKQKLNNSSIFHETTGDYFFEKGKYKFASTFYYEALKHTSKPLIYYKIAVCLKDNRKLAESYYLMYKRLNPKSNLKI